MWLYWKDLSQKWQISVIPEYFSCRSSKSIKRFTVSKHHWRRKSNLPRNKSSNDVDQKACDKRLSRVKLKRPKRMHSIRILHLLERFDFVQTAAVLLL